MSGQYFCVVTIIENTKVSTLIGSVHLKSQEQKKMLQLKLLLI